MDASQNYFHVDAFGAVLGSRQKLRIGTNPDTTPKVAEYEFTYILQADGAVTSVVYPSGREVTYQLGNRNLPVGVTSQWGVIGGAAIGSLQYTPGGAMRQALLGTGGGTQQQWKINALGETEKILVTRGAGNTTKLFELGLDYSAGGNNGNVKSLSIDTGANQFTQYFRYDGANRLQLAVENPTTPTGTTCAAAGGAWCQQLGYDGFGNIWQAAGVGNGVAGMPASKDRYWHAAVGATPAKVDNRFDGAEYDGSGNLRQYGMTGAMRANYDAEGRMTKALAAEGGPVVVENYYDGEGLRIRKKVGAAETWYVYGADRQLMAEYQNTATSVEGPRYLIGDHLGSTRLTLDRNGVVEAGSRTDYEPFGAERVRTGVAEYSGAGAGTTLRFTGKERDSELANSALVPGLDYFGARYFSSAQGRFTSPDKPFADQHPEDPQSWNLYGYVRNNPLAHVDTDGQACFALNSGSAFCGRATEYGQIDARVNGQTRFFAAASAVSQALANSDIGYGGFMSRTFAPISGTTQQFLGAVGQDLLQMNRSAAADIQSGKMRGPDLDSRMVHMEQSKVQGSLDSLKKSDPVAYKTLVAESNAGLNPTDRMRQVGSVYSTDKAYLGVLDGVRKQLGQNIDFSKQGDREAVGNALIQHIRKTGGCDVAGDKLQGCK